jgi:hypothetical protein
MASLNHKFCLSERRIFLFDELDSSGKTGGVFWFARRVLAAAVLPRSSFLPLPTLALARKCAAELAEER